jgi:hypothetical protein
MSLFWLQVQIPSGKISIRATRIVGPLVAHQISIVLHDEEAITSFRVPATLPQRTFRLGLVYDRDMAIVAQLDLIGTFTSSDCGKFSLATLVTFVDDEISIFLQDGRKLAIVRHQELIGAQMISASHPVAHAVA